MAKLSGFEALQKLKESLPSVECVSEAVQLTCMKKTRNQYDQLLSGEQQQQHNPNPFDFVFFDELQEPSLYSVAEIENGQELYSGYIDLSIKALTPLHIVGEQTPDRPGHKIQKSHFYKQAGQFCIPGSSIKGMLRSFVEAVTNGWVSQAQNKKDGEAAYAKELRKRHIGFDSFNETRNKHKVSLTSTSVVPPAIPMSYKAIKNGKIDIASYLFGIVFDSGDDVSMKGKVIIEDAVVTEGQLKNYEFPDIHKADCDGKDSPFMGGAHPSISNWWYFSPLEVWERHPVNPKGGRFHVAEFVGKQFWGRKFYYHQNPVTCVNYYKSDAWRKDQRRPLYTYYCQCLDSKESVPFRIHLNRVPQNLVNLLSNCLKPGNNIRHKLGYGKQYGFGSVEFQLNSIKLRNVTKPLNIFDDSSMSLKDFTPTVWEQRKSITVGEKSVLVESSVSEIARVLGWEDLLNKPERNIVFTYPPNQKPFFQSAVVFPDFISETERLCLPRDTDRSFATPVSEDQGLEVAKKLWNYKKPLHFILYQARARNFNRIMKRKP